MLHEVGPGDAFGAPKFSGKGRSQGSAMIPLERAMVVSYRLSIVSIALSLTIQPQFAIECLRRSNQQGWVTLGQNLGWNGSADVSQILTRSGRDMGLSHTKEIAPIYSAV